MGSCGAELSAAGPGGGNGGPSWALATPSKEVKTNIDVITLRINIGILDPFSMLGAVLPRRGVFSHWQ
jgi:hypothetical protein